MKQITFDVQRLDEDVVKFRNRAAQVEEFAKQKIKSLNSNKDLLARFLVGVNCDNLVLGNMYSTHGTVEAYTESCQLIVHATMNAKREIKNKDLLAKKLTEEWKNIMPEFISASFNHYEINNKMNGTEIKFKIWVK